MERENNSNEITNEPQHPNNEQLLINNNEIKDNSSNNIINSNNIKTSTNIDNTTSNIDSFSKPLELIQNLTSKRNYNLNTPTNSFFSSELLDFKIKSLETKLYQNKTPITNIPSITKQALFFNNSLSNSSHSKLNELFEMVGPIKPFTSYNPKIISVPKTKKYIPIIKNSSFKANNKSMNNDMLSSTMAPFMFKNVSSSLKYLNNSNEIKEYNSFGKTWSGNSWRNNSVGSQREEKGNGSGLYKEELLNEIKERRKKKNNMFNGEFYKDKLLKFGERLFGKKSEKIKEKEKESKTNGDVNINNHNNNTNNMNENENNNNDKNEEINPQQLQKEEEEKIIVNEFSNTASGGFNRLNLES